MIFKLPIANVASTGSLLDWVSPKRGSPLVGGVGVVDAAPPPNTLGSDRPGAAFGLGGGVSAGGRDVWRINIVIFEAMTRLTGFTDSP